MLRFALVGCGRTAKRRADLLAIRQIADGRLTQDDDATKAMLTRIEADERRVAVPIDLTADAQTETVRNGDSVRVTCLPPTLDSAVLVHGYV